MEVIGREAGNAHWSAKTSSEKSNSFFTRLIIDLLGLRQEKDGNMGHFGFLSLFLIPGFLHIFYHIQWTAVWQIQNN